MRTKNALRYLHSYMKLRGYGRAGKLLSAEAQEFKEYKKAHPDFDLNIMSWCVFRAMEELIK